MGSSGLSDNWYAKRDGSGAVTSGNVVVVGAAVLIWNTPVPFALFKGCSETFVLRMFCTTMWGESRGWS